MMSEGFQVLIAPQPEWEPNTIVHKNNGTGSHTSFEIAAMKEGKKNVFYVPDDKGIVVGDVLQRIGESIFWEITKLDVITYLGVQRLLAKVRKLN